MSVVRFSCPQLLYVTLSASQHPVDHKGVGVGRYLGLKILVASPTRVVASVSPRPNTLFRLEMAISTRCLTPRRRSDGSVIRRIPTSPTPLPRNPSPEGPAWGAKPKAK